MTSHSYSCVFSFQLCCALPHGLLRCLCTIYFNRAARFGFPCIYYILPRNVRQGLSPVHASRMSPISDRLFSFSSRSDRFCANITLLQRKIIKADIHIDFLFDSRYLTAVRILPDFKIIREINIRRIRREPLRIRFDPCYVEHQYERF